MSACTDFYSHPCRLLQDHLRDVGRKSRELFADSKFGNTDMAFYAGLLHDLGKLNPWYQLTFTGRDTGQYVRLHSVFSAWAADRLLDKLGPSTRDKIVSIIYGHHSRLSNRPGPRTGGAGFSESCRGAGSGLRKFAAQAGGNDCFSGLDLHGAAEAFEHRIVFDLDLGSQDVPRDYLEVRYAFSCLLQADRGSFGEWHPPRFDLRTDTSGLVRECALKSVRDEFQERARGELERARPICVIDAPTGIGKTKLFLDAIDSYARSGLVERVFYFSPLLALTEDFEAKVKTSMPDGQEDVLIYNHLRCESLAKDDDKAHEHDGPTFEDESFNRKFVITTTERLLRTLYSDTAHDSIKLASLRNSLLIVDEVQTIPKATLAGLRAMFEAMNRWMGTRFILVSATVPHELADLPRAGLPEKTRLRYLAGTKKRISMQELDMRGLPHERTLVMANTRKKARARYREILEAHPGRRVLYLSAGIRKKDRTALVKGLSGRAEPYTLVSTQVVEAGVDVSFSHVFREEAPMDSLVQVMGRLNREGGDADACLVVYPTDKNHVPYDKLEYDVTLKMMDGVRDSVQLYRALESYYEEISCRDKTCKKRVEDMRRKMAQMDFGGVWEMVRDVRHEETVIIPDMEEYDKVREAACSEPRDFLKKYGDRTASLPCNPSNIKDKFDEQLWDKHMLLPKKQHLKEIYDSKIGLDKWAGA